MEQKINIAIDGTTGSGKGTTAKKISQRLNLKYLDTGAMYRAIAFYLNKYQISPSEVKKEHLNEVDIKFDEENNVLLNGENIEKQIRTPEISKLASDYSKLATVREYLVEKQKQIVSKGGFIAEGRDIGTVVMPDAKVKIYLTASLEVRAKRRLLDFENSGIETTFQEVKKQIEERDIQDTNREHSPLTKTKDAIEIDTTDMSIEEQVSYIENLIKNSV